MGAACCGRGNTYPEIDEAVSLRELSDFLKGRQEFGRNQAEEIKEYMKDKSKIPKTLEVASITEANLGKRVVYLMDYIKVLPQAVDIINSNPKMELNSTKEVVHKLWDDFFVEYDDLKNYLRTIEELKALANK